MYQECKWKSQYLVRRTWQKFESIDIFDAHCSKSSNKPYTLKKYYSYHHPTISQLWSNAISRIWHVSSPALVNSRAARKVTLPCAITTSMQQSAQFMASCKYFSLALCIRTERDTREEGRDMRKKKKMQQPRVNELGDDEKFTRREHETTRDHINFNKIINSRLLRKKNKYEEKRQDYVFIIIIWYKKEIIVTEYR